MSQICHNSVWFKIYFFKIINIYFNIILPFPSFRTYQTTIKFFNNIKIVSIYWKFGNCINPDPVGKSVLGIGIIGDKSYDLDNEEERKKYFEEVRKKQGIVPRDREVGIDPIFSANGGEVEGVVTRSAPETEITVSDSD